MRISSRRTKFPAHLVELGRFFNDFFNDSRGPLQSALTYPRSVARKFWGEKSVFAFRQTHNRKAFCLLYHPRFLLEILLLETRSRVFAIIKWRGTDRKSWRLASISQNFETVSTTWFPLFTLIFIWILARYAPQKEITSKIDGRSWAPSHLTRYLIVMVQWLRL